MSSWNVFSNGLWSLASNWLGGVPNAVGASATFAQYGSGLYDIDLGGSTWTVGTLNVSGWNSSFRYSLDHGTINMQAGGGANATINIGNLGVGVSSQIIAADVTLKLTSNTDLTVDADAELDEKAKITGAGALRVLGGGVLTLINGASNWTGALNIQSGTVSAGADNALGLGNIIVSGTLDAHGHDETLRELVGSGTVTDSIAVASVINEINNFNDLFSGSLTGDMSFVKNGTGTLFLSGANSYTGYTDVKGGVLKGATTNALGSNTSLTVENGATFDLGGFSQSSGALNGGGTITNSGAGTATLTETNNSTAYFSGTLQDGAGSLGLTKLGTGLLTLSGFNSYTGATLVAAGSLDAGSAGAFSINSVGWNVSAGATLDLQGFSQDIQNLFGGGTITNSVGGPAVLSEYNGQFSTTFSGVLKDGGFALGLTKEGAGTFTLSGKNSYTGATTINGGTLKIGSSVSGSLGSSLFVNAGASLDLNGLLGTIGNNAPNSGQLWGGGSIFNSAAGSFASLVVNGVAASSFEGVISDGAGTVQLIKNGGGELDIWGANTYSGPTIVNGGTLALQAGGSISNSVMALNTGSTLDIAGVSATTASVKSLALSNGSLNLGGKTLSIANEFYASLFGGQVNGSAGLDEIDIHLSASNAGFDLSSTNFANWTDGVDQIAIYGNGVGDSITGSSHNDRIYGGAGNDTIDGGAGIDTAFYSVNRAGATITRNADGSVTINAGVDGVDTLKNVEWANFADGSVFIGAQRDDFNNDGASDILWQYQATGDVYEWQMSNGQHTGNDVYLGNLSGWNNVGVGDFYGAGTAGVLWQSQSTGDVYEWRMSGGQHVGSAYLGNLSGWSEVGVGDFTGNGTDDLLWQNQTTGDVYEWTMSNGQHSGSDVYLGNLSGYSEIGVGDFHGNGTSDLLWQNQATGDVYEWTMSNGQHSGNDVYLGNLSGYSEIGVGDFAGNETSDLLWQNQTTGDVYEWRMSNGQHTGNDVYLGNLSGWSVVGTGDYAGSGVSDIIWQNQSNGATYEWTMSAGQHTGDIFLGNLAGWHGK